MANIVLEVDELVALVTIDRQSKANALTSDLWRQLGSTIRHAGSRDDVQVILLRGAGDRHFSAGADLVEVADVSRDEAAASALAAVIVDTLWALSSVKKPTVAVLNGVAAGGGAELAVAADIRVASSAASISFPMREVGAAIDALSLSNIVNLVGRRVARQLLFFEDRVSAERALEIGLVDRVVPPESLAKEAAEVARRLVMSPRQLRLALADDLRSPELQDHDLRRVAERFAAGLANREPLGISGHDTVPAATSIWPR